MSKKDACNSLFQHTSSEPSITEQLHMSHKNAYFVIFSCIKENVKLITQILIEMKKKNKECKNNNKNLKLEY